MNFLEQLVAEWYAYRGYFVRTNVMYGKRTKGGYVGEMDVVAYEPREKHLVHVETSSDARTWAERATRFTEKFRRAAPQYRNVFSFDYNSIERLAVVGYTGNVGMMRLGRDIRAVSIRDFVLEVSEEVSRRSPLRGIVPEVYPRLRAIQLAAYYLKHPGVNKWEAK